MKVEQRYSVTGITAIDKIESDAEAREKYSEIMHDLTMKTHRRNMSFICECSRLLWRDNISIKEYRKRCIKYRRKSESNLRYKIKSMNRAIKRFRPALFD